MRNWVVGLAFGACVGCGPLALQHGAGTVPPGKVAAGGSTLVAHEIGQGAAKDSSRTYVGESAGFVRWGINEQIDAGVQVYPMGMRLDAKMAFINTESIAVSIDPGIHMGYYRSTSENEDLDSKSTTSAFMTGYDLTIAVGKKLGNGSEVWIAPRFGSFTMDYKSEEEEEGDSFKFDANVNYRGYGAGMGAKLKIGEALWLLPELGCYQRETKTTGAVDRGLNWVPAIGIATGF